MSKQWEKLKAMHSGDTIVAESVIFSSLVEKEEMQTFSESLFVRDVEGKELEILLPSGFAGSLLLAGKRALIDKEDKTEDDFQYFAKQYRLYFNHQADTNSLREMFFHEACGICFIESNLETLHSLDDITLSADTLADSE